MTDGELAVIAEAHHMHIVGAALRETRLAVVCASAHITNDAKTAADRSVTAAYRVNSDRVRVAADSAGMRAYGSPEYRDDEATRVVRKSNLLIWVVSGVIIGLGALLALALYVMLHAGG